MARPPRLCVRLKESYALPIRTYVELGIDSFESILGTFAKINEIGEGVALQVVLRPAGKDVAKSIRKYIELLKKGESAKKVFGDGFPMSLKDVGEVFNPKTGEEKTKEKSERVVDEEMVKALQAKIAKPLFETNVRIVASAGSQFQVEDIIDGVAAGFGQFGSPTRNDFKIVKPRNPKGIIKDFIYPIVRHGDQTMVLSSEEVASFYHLPISTTETPRVKWLKSREAPPPENLPKAGLLLGDAVFRGQVRAGVHDG